jgi:hypothetical protein
MFFLAGAAGSVLSYLAALPGLSSTSSPATGSTQTAAASRAFAPGVSAVTAPPPFLSGGGFLLSSDTMSALFAGQSQTDGASSLSTRPFSLLDTNGDGKIDKSEFEAAFGQNGNVNQADSILAKLDRDNDGAVSQTELSSALQSHGHHRHHRHAPTGGISMGAAGADAASGQSTGNATTKTTTNADGSTTTTISYADGSQVSMTTPVAGGSAGVTAIVLERLIQRQARMLSASAPSLMMNV